MKSRRLSKKKKEDRERRKGSGMGRVKERETGFCFYFYLPAYSSELFSRFLSVPGASTSVSRQYEKVFIIHIGEKRS